jgi:formyltetrahydrofolate synthetase
VFATQTVAPIELGSALVGATGEFDLAVTPRVAAGDYQLQFVGKTMAGDILTLAVTTTVTGSSAGQARGWTRDFGNNQLKLYTREIIGAGKVRFVVNGREIAWVRAVDGNDRKLNVAGDGMVRTVTAVPGRNVFEIYIGDERVVRRIFTRR